MSEAMTETSLAQGREERAAALFREHETRIFRRTDRMFACLMIFQWLAGIGAALWISPRTWSGAWSEVHVHVWTAVLLGGLITSLPVLLALTRPGAASTRHVIATAQMLTSALLIHLTGGRIETHFHVFGSLAFLAFYRDWRVLITASTVVAVDHLLRGVYWPQSVFGVLTPEPWRWLEHAGWVIFEDCFLVLSIVQGRDEMIGIAERQAHLETVNDVVESEVRERTAELRESEHALREALEKAKESDRLKSEFLSSMSHEVRTPLNGVIGMSHLLLDTGLTGEQREYAETVRSSADTLLTLINDILDFSKIEAGRLSIEPIPFDLEMAVEEVVELFGPKAAEKELDLVIRYAPGTPNRVIGDPGRVRQVLTNLVGNAVKFTESGHVFVNVECERRDETRAWFYLSVEDTGIGIPVEHQKHVFDRFTQADASTTRRYGGTGLGLAISKQLVELMGGEIGVRSEPGDGSRFWFRLPLPLDPDREQASAITHSDLTNVRVLIVDDNAVNRRVLHELIRRWGLRDGEAASAIEALSELRAAWQDGDPYRIGILDLNMPVTDGETLAKTIKADAALRDTVLLLLTSSGHRGDAQRMSEAGFTAYLTKPVRPSLLMDALATAWAARTVRREAVLITRHSLAEREAKRPRVPTAPQAVRSRVLVVEDNSVNQKVARLLLERLGCRVDLASDGREAVELSRKISYDVIFMDCQMPVMDGYEATREIRRLEGAGRRTPIVAMTALAMPHEREQCLEVGMDDFVGKPVSREALRQAVERWLPREAEAASLRVSPSPRELLDTELARNLHSMEEEGGPEFVMDLLTGFLRNCRESLARLRKAATGPDAATMQRIAHDLKGVSATLGAMSLATAARDLEAALAGESAAEASGAVDVIGNELDRLETALVPYLEKSKPTANEHE